MTAQFIKPRPTNIESSPARPTSLYVTPPLEILDDEYAEDPRLEQYSNSTLTPLSSIKSNSTFKQDHQRHISEQCVTRALPSLSISTPPITPNDDDDLSFFKPPPPPKVNDQGLYLQPGGHGPTSEFSLPSSTPSPSLSTSKRILSSPARLMKRLSVRFRSTSDVSLGKKDSDMKMKSNTSIVSPAQDSCLFDSRPSSYEQNSLSLKVDPELNSFDSIRVKIPRGQIEDSQSPVKSTPSIVNELGSPLGKEASRATRTEMQLAQSTPSSSPINRRSTFVLERLDQPTNSRKFDRNISTRQSSEVRNITTNKRMSLDSESDMFRTPPQYRKLVRPESSLLVPLSPPSRRESLGHSLNSVQTVFDSPLPRSRISCSPVESNPYLRLNIFLEDSQSTPPPKAGTGVTDTSIMPSPDNYDFIAIRLRKDRLQNINELVNVILFKIMNKKPNVKVNDVNLSIFFKDSQLKPISLKEPVGKRSSTSSVKGVLLDNDGLLLDYVQLKRKLYIRAQF
ncbi:hypothetical protein KGF57_003654 [Candida theae]|uniref:Uncharacterized protein n=1 Tax=Candida theae TaxID=1198502 RepID=A0AAD5BD71_9ASCO|nr:uncharacterized protein KGF57_003654 [Candida theae]KAI5955522.1 hypothetical protein KGF57_003654 [Candida theae]